MTSGQGACLRGGGDARDFICGRSTGCDEGHTRKRWTRDPARGRETDIELVVFEEYEPAKDKAGSAEVPAGAASGAIRD